MKQNQHNPPKNHRTRTVNQQNQSQQKTSITKLLEVQNQETQFLITNMHTSVVFDLISASLKNRAKLKSTSWMKSANLQLWWQSRLPSKTLKGSELWTERG